MSDHQTLQFTTQNNGVAEIILNRPEQHNAFNETLIDELAGLLQSLKSNEEIRLIVLKGTGSDFCAGADLNWMKAGGEKNWDANYQDALKMATLMQSLKNIHIPTMAVIQGAVYGGGIGLVACCDFAVASDNTKFCFAEAKLGLIPSVISPYVIDVIGARACRRLFVTAEVFNVDYAYHLGLVSEIVAENDLQKISANIIKQIIANSPQAVKEAKNLIEYISTTSLDEELIRDTAIKIADLRASAEGKEGVSAFLEKRKANWNVAAKELNVE